MPLPAVVVVLVRVGVALAARRAAQLAARKAAQEVLKRQARKQLIKRGNAEAAKRARQGRGRQQKKGCDAACQARRRAKCAELKARIALRISAPDKDNLLSTQGLLKRWSEQVSGKGPGQTVMDPKTGGHKIPWDTHDAEMRNRLKGLEDDLKEYGKHGCKPPMRDAWKIVHRGTPKPSDWRGP